ncbi:hypothetical protein ACJ41O_013730 [Fusarium nematophilum]
MLAMSTREVIQALLPPGCDADGAVVAEGSEPSLGKRIFIVNPNDFSLRPVTAGPVILQRYQLTVAHAFQHNSEPGQSFDQGAAEEDDCDFDGMSDDEGDDESQDNEMTRRGSVTPDGMDSDKGSFTAKLDMLSSGEGSDIGSKGPSSDHSNNEHGSQHSVEFVPDNSNRHDLDVSLLQFFGKLALSSLTGSNPSLDYALI